MSMTHGADRCWLVWSRRFSGSTYVCGEIDTVLQNLDAQAEYSVLGDAFGVRRVLPTLTRMIPALPFAHTACSTLNMVEPTTTSAARRMS
jgi:hypothetical protein